MNQYWKLLQSNWQQTSSISRSLALFFVYFALHYGYSLLSEKIQINEGLGMDGAIYGALTKNFAIAPTLGLVDTAIQRMLPSGIAYLLLKMLDLPLENSQVIAAFAFMNSAGIASCFVLLYWIMRHLRLNSEFHLLGATAFAFSFATLKWPAYYPILTDAVATALAAAMFLAYLKRKPGWVVAILCAASFTWPSLTLVGYALLLLPSNKHPIVTSPLSWDSRENRIYLYASGFVTAVIMGISLSILIRSHGLYVSSEVYQPVLWALPISYALMGMYFMWGLYGLTSAARPFWGRKFLHRFSILGILLSMFLFFSLPWLRELVFNPAPSLPYYAKLIIKAVLTLGVASPGRFIIPHIVYFGPLFVFTCLYWRRICRLANQIGAGVVMVLAMGLLQSLDSESRHLAHLLPLVLPLTLRVMQDQISHQKLSKWFITWMLGFSIVFSRVWLSIGGEPSNFDIFNPKTQMYFMNHGPWTASGPYMVQFAAVVIAGILLYILWRRNVKKVTHNTP